MAERMLKFGICSNVRVLNTQSTSYHPIASSSVNRIEQNEIGAGSGITSTTATTLIMMNGGGSDSILSGSSSASASSAAATLVDSSSLSSIGSSPSGITLQFHSLSSNLSSGSNNSTSSSGGGMIGGGSSGSGLGNSSSGGLNSNASGGNSGSNSNAMSNIGSGVNGADLSHITFPNAPIFSSVCFHPTSPTLYVAIRNEIYFYDLLNQSIKGKLMIDGRESIQSIVTLNYSGNNLQKFLLCFTQEGLLYLWDTDTHKLITIVHPIKQFDTRSITCKAIAPGKAVVFYSKSNSKDIVVEDFEKGSMTSKLKGHKKPISSLAHHPIKPYLASVSIDGSLKIWDTKSQIALLNLEDFTSYENSRNIEHSSNFFLTFESTSGKYMVMTGSSGLTLVYGDLTTSSQELIAIGFICKGNTILSLVHHPQLPIFFIVSINHQTGIEEISAWEVNYQMKSIVPSSLLSGVFLPSGDDILGYLPQYSKPLVMPRLSTSNIIFHPTRNLLTFQWHLECAGTPQYLAQQLSSIRHINQYIYSINPFDNVQRASLPLISNIPLPLGFFFTPESQHTFTYPPEIVFFDGVYLRAYVPLNGITRKLISTPIISPTGDEICRAKRFSYNQDLQLVSLIFDSYSISTQTLLSKYLLVDVAGSISQQGEGIDAVMIGSSHILILGGFDGKIAKVAALSGQGVSAFKNHQLSPKIASVFKTPLQDGRVVQYYSQEKNCILFSKNINPSEKDNYSVDTQIQLYLFKNEKVYKIEWQSDYQKNIHICAIMTDMRIIITNSKMEVINQTQVPPSHRNSSCYFTSIYWLEWTLLYTTPTHLMYITLQNNLLPRPISSLSIAPIVLSVVFPDRIIYAYQGVGIGSNNARVAMSSITNSSSASQNSLLSSSTDSTSSSGSSSAQSSSVHSTNVNNSNYINNQTVVHALSVGLLECMVVGLLSLPSWLAPTDKKQTSLYLQNLVSRFEYTRTSRFMLDKLRERGFVDLTYSLANNMRTSHSKLSSLDKFRLAWSSKQYQDAHRHLIEEYNRQLTSAKLVTSNSSAGSSSSGSSSSSSNSNEQPFVNGASLNGANGPQTLDKRSFGRLKELMRDFARECVNAGYYNLAKDCFARLGEHVYLLQIAVILGDREAVQQIRKDAETRSDAVLISACDKFLSKKSANGSSMTENGKLNPPVIKILPWQPTDHINLGIKAGNDYLSPINLNNINRYFPITGVFNTASSYGSQRHKLRSPDESWPPQDYKHSVALSPPRTLMTLVANKLSTKSHISSTHTLRRSPSSENITMSTGGSGVRFNTSQIGADNDYDSDDSESGADADVDSDNEDDLHHISKSLEDHMKGLTTTTSDSHSMGEYEDDVSSRSSTIDSATPPLSSTPTTGSI